MHFDSIWAQTTNTFKMGEQLDDNKKKIWKNIYQDYTKDTYTSSDHDRKHLWMFKTIDLELYEELRTQATHYRFTLIVLEHKIMIMFKMQKK